MSKKAIIPSVTLVALIMIGVLGSSVAQAQNFGGNTPMVQKLAETFGLQEDEVEAVFEAVRDEHHEQMRLERANELDQAVADGVLTEDQKQALLNYQDTIREEGRARMQEHRDEMEAWFSENGIDHEALQQYMGSNGPKGPRGPKNWN